MHDQCGTGVKPDLVLRSQLQTTTTPGYQIILLLGDKGIGRAT